MVRSGSCSGLRGEGSVGGAGLRCCGSIPGAAACGAGSSSRSRRRQTRKYHAAAEPEHPGEHEQPPPPAGTGGRSRIARGCRHRLGDLDADGQGGGRTVRRGALGDQRVVTGLHAGGKRELRGTAAIATDRERVEQHRRGVTPHRRGRSRLEAAQRDREVAALLHDDPAAGRNGHQMAVDHDRKLHGQATGGQHQVTVDDREVALDRVAVDRDGHIARVEVGRTARRVITGRAGVGGCPVGGSRQRIARVGATARHR